MSEKTDGTKWEKAFDSNQKFTLTLTDLAGNTAKTKRYEIKNIENELEIFEPSYDVTGQPGDQMAESIYKSHEGFHYPDRPCRQHLRPGPL